MGAFENLPSLERLRLDHNRLHTLHAHTIISLPALRWLSLAHNYINGTQVWGRFRPQKNGKYKNVKIKISLLLKKFCLFIFQLFNLKIFQNKVIK
jgi:Leucine-rich repeat (LRR) protein